MQIRSRRFLIALFIIMICCAGAAADGPGEKTLPAFGRDTVLVWKIQHLDYSADFVIRIAQFVPDRYMEWENESAQGTVFMPGQDMGDETLTVEVNRVPQILPVIKVTDDRKEERWFLDEEDNPLMLSHRARKYSQTLTTITTDKSNTLRWIKGRKLENPPH
jgi:hypothetical protein